MKLILVLPFLATTISSALFQPRIASDDSVSESVSLNASSNLDNNALCEEASEYVKERLAEIVRLQTGHLPVPSDLGGYLFAVIKGREMLGCPSISGLNANGSFSSASPHSTRNSSEAIGDPCEVTRIVHEEVMYPIGVLKESKVPIPPFLAGWYSTTLDVAKYLGCQFSGAGWESLTKSTDASSGDTTTA